MKTAWCNPRRVATHAIPAVTAAVLLTASPLIAQQPAPQAGPGTAVSGEVRLRSEAARPSSLEEWDNFTLMRTRIGLLATLNPQVRAFVQLQDSRVFGQAPTTLSPAANTFDLHQGYLELSSTLGELPVALRAGRQEIVLGNERLVGAVGWHNVGRSFDAARLSLGSARTPLSGGLFLATVHEGNASYRGLSGNHLEKDHWFTGAFAATRLLEGYALYDNNAHERSFSGIDRATLGARLQAPATSRFIGSLEGAYQTGSQQARVGESVVEQDIQAYFAGARAGVKTGVAVLPSLGVGVDYLSGGESATGSEYRAFNTLYATNHRYYGYMDLFLNPAARTKDRGLVDAMLNARTGLGRAGVLEIDVHRFSLANTSGISDAEIGWELDLTYPFRIAEAGRFVFGYSVFRGGSAAPALGLGADGKISHWGFLQAAVPF
jgi:hypothetical protein